MPAGIPQNVTLKKRNDGNFYVLFDSDTNVYSYLFDTKSLAFKRINLPEEGNNIDYNFFEFKDAFLAIKEEGTLATFYKLTNQSKFEKLASKQFSNVKGLSIKDVFVFENHLIINEENSGAFVITKDGNYLAHITPADIGIGDNVIDHVVFIENYFEFNTNHYFKFFGLNDIFQYHPNSKKWRKIETIDGFPIAKLDKQFSTEIVADGLGSYLQIKHDPSNKIFTRYFSDRTTMGNYFNTDLVGAINTASRDYRKELFVANAGKLYHYSFDDGAVSTFLKTYSIRGIIELTPDSFLVGTENNGWFTVTISTGKVESYNVTLKDASYIPSANRNFFKSKLGFWNNNPTGMVHVNEDSRKMDVFVLFPVATMVEDESSIFYGTKNYNLIRFDKATGTNHILVSTPTLDIQDIIKVDAVIYGASTTGLFQYKDEKLSEYYPSTSIDDNYLLSLDYDKTYGILAGSKTGKLYQFLPKENTFKLLYQDKIVASIASTLVDNSGRIWINTFRGIVCYNPKTGVEERFSTGAGLSFYECNRYSALKTSDGRFMVGTLEGLNYFDPEMLRVQNYDAKFKITSLNYFDKKTNSQRNFQSELAVADISKITLSATNRNLDISFGLFGIYEKNDINFQYRINGNDWINSSKLSDLRLVNMASGDYLLEIEAIDSSNRQIGETQTLTIEVKEFFYKTPTFYIITIIFLLTVGIWYVRFIKRRHRVEAQFAKELHQTQERERSRIAKDLHDGVGQKLLLLKNKIFNSEVKNEENEQLFSEAMKEVREVSHSLYPFRFEKQGLVTSLRLLFEQFQRSSNIFYSAEIDDITGILAIDKEIVIFRMIQECVSNVEKHSKAEACKLTAENTKKHIIFKIMDNGVGFNNTTSKDGISEAGIGMKTLNERAKFIGASFSISTEKNKGTTTIIKMPKE